MDAGLKNIAIGKRVILAEKSRLRQNELPKACTIIKS
jgi:hypothetical protein